MLSALGNYLTGIADSYTGGAIGEYFGKRSRRDAANVSWDQYVKQRALDFAYASGPEFDLAQRYNQANYALAQRYAENTASWAVQGLKSAGLNPILAAGAGFNANTGSSGVVASSGAGSMPSVSSDNPKFDLAEAARDLASIGQMSSSSKQMDSQTELNNAQIFATKANTAKTLIGAYNDLIDGGNKGAFGTALRIADGISPERSDRKSLRQGFENMLRDTLGVSTDTTSTAKDVPNKDDSKSNDMHITVDVPKKSTWSGRGSVEVEEQIEDLLRQRYMNQYKHFRK